MVKVIGFVFAALLASVSTALAQSVGDSELLRDLQVLTLRCVAQPYSIDKDGKQQLEALKSVCPELQEARNGGVVITIEGRNLHAVLTESEDSDGGDLDHLVIIDSKGDVVAERRNVAAFDNIFIGLAGGRDDFRQIPIQDQGTF